MDSIKKKQRCQQNCQEHIFDLQNQLGNNKYDVNLSFCPKFRRDPYPPQRTIPEFNFDKKHFTSAFLLGTEKKSISANSHQEFVHFTTQIRQAQQKNNQIFFPKPNEKNTYCSVCKQHYPNYYEHIQSQDHRQKIDAAIYNTEIRKLCQNFRDTWDGAHEQADKEVMDEYMKVNKQIGDDSEQNSEEDGNTQQKKSNEFKDKRKLDSDEDEDELDEENEEDIFNIQAELLAKVPIITPKYMAPIKEKTSEVEIRMLKELKEQQKKKKEKDESYSNQFIQSTIRNGVPPQQIRTRSALALLQKQKKDDPPENNSQKQFEKQIHEQQNHKTKKKKQISQQNDYQIQVRNNQNNIIGGHIFPQSDQANKNIVMPDNSLQCNSRNSYPQSSRQQNQMMQHKKSQLVVLLRKNSYGKYQIMKQSKKKGNDAENVSLQVRISKDTKQIVRNTNTKTQKRQIHKPVKNVFYPQNNNRQNSSEQFIPESQKGQQNLCQTLKSKYHNKKNVSVRNSNEKQPQYRQRNSESVTPERALAPDGRPYPHGQNMPYPYPAYYSYRMPPQMSQQGQGRMPMYPYPSGPSNPNANPNQNPNINPNINNPSQNPNVIPNLTASRLSPGTNKQQNPQQSNMANKPYYPYQFQYPPNSWFPQYVMPQQQQQQMMRSRQTSGNTPSTGNNINNTTSPNPQQYQKYPPMYQGGYMPQGYPNSGSGNASQYPTPYPPYPYMPNVSNGSKGNSSPQGFNSSGGTENPRNPSSHSNPGNQGNNQSPYYMGYPNRYPPGYPYPNKQGSNPNLHTNNAPNDSK